VGGVEADPGFGAGDCEGEGEFFVALADVVLVVDAVEIHWRMLPSRCSRRLTMNFS